MNLAKGVEREWKSVKRCWGQLWAADSFGLRFLERDNRRSGADYLLPGAVWLLN